MGRRVKVVCHTCGGTGKVEETDFETRQKILCICPECLGDGWVWMEKADEK